MKLFLFTAIKFTSIFVFILGLNTCLNYIIFYNSKLPISETNIIIAGDSHTQKSLNPIRFNSAVNISQSAEPYVLTYWKLRYIFKHYRPDILLLGFGHHNISAFNDMKFWNEQWSSEMFRRSYLINSFGTINKIKIDYHDFYKIYFRQMCLFPHNNHFAFMGGYTNSDKSDLSDIESPIRRHYFFEKEELGVSETAVSYLDSILGLCERYEVIPILIGSPVHEEYFKLIPNIIKEKYKFEKERIKNNNVIFLDFTNDFYEDSFYLNADHINEKGSSRFTDAIIQILRSLHAQQSKISGNNG